MRKYKPQPDAAMVFTRPFERDEWLDENKADYKSVRCFTRDVRFANTSRTIYCVAAWKQALTSK